MEGGKTRNHFSERRYVFCHVATFSNVATVHGNYAEGGFAAGNFAEGNFCAPPNTYIYFPN